MTMSMSDGPPEDATDSWEPPDTDFLVTSVQFGQEMIAVTYFDMRMSSDQGSAEVVLTMSDKEHHAVITDIKDAVRDMIDEYIVYSREPPDSLEAGANRLRARREAQDEEDDSSDDSSDGD